MFRRYHIPIYTVRLVRESSLPAEHPVLSDPAAVARLLWQYLAEADREHFVGSASQYYSFASRRDL